MATWKPSTEKAREYLRRADKAALSEARVALALLSIAESLIEINENTYWLRVPD